MDGGRERKRERERGERFVAKLLFTVSSGVHAVACIPPATAKLSHRINFKGLEENEGHYRH